MNIHLNSILKTGCQVQNSKETNSKIEICNFISIVLIFLSLPFGVYSYFFFNGLTFINVLFIIVILIAIFCNFLFMYSLSKFLISVVLTLLFTIYHAYVMQTGDQPIACLYALQLSFCVFPWYLYPKSEQKNLYVVLFLNLLMFYSIPYINDYFNDIYNNDLLKNTGILSSSILIVSVIGISSGLFFFNKTIRVASDETNELFTKINEDKEKFKQNESTLKVYIEETEKNKLLEDQRTWAATGTAKFSQILRNHDNLTALGDALVIELVKYLGANQAAIFMDLNDENPDNAYLEMLACYAYDRKKYLQKRIQPGQGMVGQVYLERKYVYTNKIPQDYIKITSGLGVANPKYLLLMPLIANDEIEGVLEIASFNALETHQIAFVEKIAEDIASMITSVKITENTKKLLGMSQTNAEQLRSQEEEMRQNIEEMMATQEELSRRKIETEAHSEMLDLIIDNIPFPIFLKDQHGKYKMVNLAETKLFGKLKSEIIGKDDSYFVSNLQELEDIKTSDQSVILSRNSIELPMQSITLANGKKHIFKTIKTPFLDKSTNEISILGVSVEVSNSLSDEEKAFKNKVIFNNNLTINLAGRQRMLSQKIGFLSMLHLAGDANNESELAQTMQLFDDSIFVLKNGGMTKGLNPDSFIVKLIPELLPTLYAIDLIWAETKKEIDTLKDNTIAKDEIMCNIKITLNRLLEKSNQLVMECSQHLQQ